MNPDFDEQLEGEIDRHLKGLPDLVAPPTLVSQTMQRIARHRDAWQRRVVGNLAREPPRGVCGRGRLALLASTVFGLRAV